ncbi:MAG: response regulator [Candidatus Bathyarchaeota archaeon]|nr:response regulator [Candidatus Bathyarchaeota archaeon]
MNKKILLIEDERILSEMYAARLEREGYEVINSRDAEGGITLIKKEKPNLILLDLLLPGMQGQEALKILKEDPVTKDIPIIILSNYDTPKVRKQSKEYNTKYILKADITTRDLVELVREEMESPGQE